MFIILFLLQTRICNFTGRTYRGGTPSSSKQLVKYNIFSHVDNFCTGIAEVQEKNTALEAKLSELESINTELMSSNKMLEKKFADAVEREKITSQRLGQDLTEERQHSHTMGMRVDVLSKENTELTENLTKVLFCVQCSICN